MMVNRSLSAASLGNSSKILKVSIEDAADRALQGCCQSTPREEDQGSPYSPSNVHGDSSSRAITTSAPHLPDTSSPRNSESRGPQVGHRSRNRRNIALGEQFNAPLRPHVWTSQRQWTRSALDRERIEFFETRVTGHTEIWATLKIVIGLVQEGDVPTAQSILDAAAITLPTGDLKNGAYDSAGNLYQMPEHVVSDPTNTIMDQPKDDVKRESSMNGPDDEEMERKRDEKGKSVVKDLIKVKARLSDRGGPDVIVSIGEDQAVRTLSRRIAEEANVG